MAADAVLVLDGPYDNTDVTTGNTYVTSSFTPSANRPVYVLVVTFGTSTAPTSVTLSTGHTLTLVAGSAVTSGARRAAWYSAPGVASPTSGTVTVTVAANTTGCHIVVVEATGVDEQSDAGVVEAAAASGSSTFGTVTLTVDAANMTLVSATHVAANEDTVGGGSLSELQDTGGATPTQRTATYEGQGVSNPSASWATTGVYLMSALEIRAAAGASDVGPLIGGGRLLAGKLLGGRLVRA